MAHSMQICVYSYLLKTDLQDYYLSPCWTPYIPTFTEQALTQTQSKRLHNKGKQSASMHLGFPFRKLWCRVPQNMSKMSRFEERCWGISVVPDLTLQCHSFICLDVCVTFMWYTTLDRPWWLYYSWELLIRPPFTGTKFWNSHPER